jgi:hypothetical protein
VVNGVDVATIVGLGVALLGPAMLFTPARRLLGDTEGTAARVVELLFLWLLAGTMLVFVVWWEGLGLAAIGLALRWRSVVLGLFLALVFVRVISPLRGGPGARDDAVRGPRVRITPRMDQ